MTNQVMEVGTVNACDKAHQAAARAGVTVEMLIDWHRHGHWGNLDRFEKHANCVALKEGGTVLSAYDMKPGGMRVLVFTNASRTHTYVTFPNIPRNKGTLV